MTLNWLQMCATFSPRPLPHCCWPCRYLCCSWWAIFGSRCWRQRVQLLAAAAAEVGRDRAAPVLLAHLLPHLQQQQQRQACLVQLQRRCQRRRQRCCHTSAGRCQASTRQPSWKQRGSCCGSVQPHAGQRH